MQFKLLLFFIVVIPQFLFASEPPVIEIDPRGSTQLVQGYFRQYLDDIMGELSPGEVRQKADQFIHPGRIGDHLSKLVFPSTYWLWFKIKNSSHQTQKRTLAFDQQIFRAEMTCTGTSQMTPQRSGPWVPYNKRTFYHDRVAFDIQLPPLEEANCLIKYSPLLSPLLDVTIQPHHVFVQQLQKDLIIYSFFYGSAFILVLYHLIIYFTLRQKALLFYAGLVISMSISLSFRDGWPNYLFPTNENWIIPLGWSTVGMHAFIQFFLLRYGRELTGLLQQFSRIKKPYKVLEIVVFIPLFLVPFAGVQAGYLANIMSLFVFLVLLPLTFLQGIKGNRLAWWFFITLSLQLGGLVLEVLRVQSVIPSTLITRYAIFGLTFLEYLLLAWVMSRRFNLRLVGLVAEKTDKLQTANLDLATLNEEKNNFLNIAAHDLKTPLHNINLMAHFIREKMSADATEVREKLDHIKNSSEEMGNLVSDLLDVDKIESQTEIEAFEGVDLSRFAQKIIWALQPHVEEKQLELVFHKPEQPLFVMGNGRWVEHALINLLSNGIKYSPQGGTLILAIKPQGEMVKFEVTDQGPGIPECERDQLFKKFNRLSTRKTKSTGLGLYLVQQVMEKMGGRVYLDEGQNEGARFVLEFQGEKN